MKLSSNRDEFVKNCSNVFTSYSSQEYQGSAGLCRGISLLLCHQKRIFALPLELARTASALFRRILQLKPGSELSRYEPLAISLPPELPSWVVQAVFELLATGRVICYGEEGLAQLEAVLGMLEMVLDTERELLPPSPEERMLPARYPVARSSTSSFSAEQPAPDSELLSESGVEDEEESDQVEWLISSVVGGADSLPETDTLGYRSQPTMLPTSTWPEEAEQGFEGVECTGSGHRCGHCSQSFPLSIALKKHIKTEHGVLVEDRPAMPRKRSSSSLDENNYHDDNVGNYCDDKTRDSRSPPLHICSSCGKAFDSAALCESHRQLCSRIINLKNTAECMMCQRQIPKQEMGKHLEACHGHQEKKVKEEWRSPSKENHQKPAVNIRTCKTCGKQYKMIGRSKRWYLNHIQECNNTTRKKRVSAKNKKITTITSDPVQQAASPELAASTATDNGALCCHVCRRQFKTAARLMAHYGSVHYFEELRTLFVVDLPADEASTALPSCMFCPFSSTVKKLVEHVAVTHGKLGPLLPPTIWSRLEQKQILHNLGATKKTASAPSSTVAADNPADEEQSSGPSASPAPVFTCYICRRLFPLLAKLRQHYVTSHFSQQVLDMFTSSRQHNSPIKEKCLRCDHVALPRHMIEHSNSHNVLAELLPPDVWEAIRPGQPARRHSGRHTKVGKKKRIKEVGKSVKKEVRPGKLADWGCTKCSKGFESANKLSRHYILIHYSDQLGVQAENDADTVFCSSCSYKGASPHRLAVHLGLKHGRLFSLLSGDLGHTLKNAYHQEQRLWLKRRSDKATLGNVSPAYSEALAAVNVKADVSEVDYSKTENGDIYYRGSCLTASDDDEGSRLLDASTPIPGEGDFSISFTDDETVDAQDRNETSDNGDGVNVGGFIVRNPLAVDDGPVVERRDADDMETNVFDPSTLTNSATVLNDTGTKLSTMSLSLLSTSSSSSSDDDSLYF